MAGVRDGPRLRPQQHRRQQTPDHRNRSLPQRTGAILMNLRGLIERIRHSALVRALGDTRGAAAIEMGLIAPAMLSVMFGTTELASGVAIDRKVTITSRSLSDL